MHSPLQHLLVALLVTGGTTLHAAAPDRDATRLRLPSAPDKARGLRVAWRIVEALKARDAGRLALATHPTRGVRFHAAVDAPKKETVRFSRRQMRDFYVSRTVVRWGHYDASGGPIDLRPRDFARQILFNRDFTRADSVTFNPGRGPGIAISNLAELHPRALRIAFFIDSSEGRMDWQQLIVLLEPFRGRWCLVALAHNEWTN